MRLIFAISFSFRSCLLRLQQITAVAISYSPYDARLQMLPEQEVTLSANSQGQQSATSGTQNNRQYKQIFQSPQATRQPSAVPQPVVSVSYNNQPAQTQQVQQAEQVQAQRSQQVYTR
jgi:hypothetical protein